MDHSGNDRHGLDQLISPPANGVRHPHSSSDISGIYHHTNPHDIRQYPNFDSQRHYLDWHYAPNEPLPAFAPENQHHRDRDSFLVNQDHNQYLPYHVQHYRYYPHPPPQNYIQYRPQQGLQPDGAMLIADNHPSVPSVRLVPAYHYPFDQYSTHYRPLSSHHSNDISPEQRAYEPYPWHIMRASRGPVHLHYPQGIRLPRDDVKDLGSAMPRESSIVHSVVQGSTRTDAPSEESEEKAAAKNPGLRLARPEPRLKERQTKTTVVSKNPFLTLSREGWQEKLKRPSSPMSQEQRDIWHQNISYALDAYVFPFPGPPFKCPVCDKEERRRSELITHIRSHMSGPSSKPFVCKLCGKGYRRPCLLEDHMERHATFAYVCNVCGRGFHRESSLQEHQENSHMKKQSRSS